MILQSRRLKESFTIFYPRKKEWTNPKGGFLKGIQ